MRRRSIFAAAIWSSFVVASCAKSERAPAPPGEPPPQNAPVATPTSAPTASATLEPTAPETPSPEPDTGSDKKDALKGGVAKEKEAAEPQTLAEAEKALSEAKGTLDTLLGKAKATAPGGGATPLSNGDTRCPDACKAMGSLKRAASAVCRLAGDGDARCGKAKGIVKDSETRVSACKCAS